MHLDVADTSVCATRCREGFGNPCQRFCSANVYEMVADEARGREVSSFRSTPRTASTARPATSPPLPDHHLGDSRRGLRAGLQALVAGRAPGRRRRLEPAQCMRKPPPWERAACGLLSATSEAFVSSDFPSYPNYSVYLSNIILLDETNRDLSATAAATIRTK